MRVLNCCLVDWAGFSHDNANALRSVGIKCEDVVLRKHSFGYEGRGQVLTRADILRKIKVADIVQVMHSDIRMLTFCRSVKHKRIIAYHTGSNYRMDSKKFNLAFNPHVERSIIALGEFSGLGAFNESYMVGAVDTGELTAELVTKKPYRIAHYPSNAAIKGTAIIHRVMNSLLAKRKDFSFKASSQTVAHQVHLDRVRNCDIYIEMMAPFQEGFRYGSFGIQALEAAALGKVVVTNHVTEHVYRQTYGIATPFVIANTEEELRAKVEQLLDISPEQIHAIQDRTRKWVEEFHGYEATGKRLREMLGI